MVVMTLFRRAFLILTVALLFTPATAAPGPASKFISELGAEALRALADPQASGTRRESEFRRLFLKNFDVNAIARFVVGNHWRSASEAEQQRFRKLFEDYVVAAYAARLGAYSGEKFQVKDEVQAGDDIMVNSTIVRASGQPTRVEWRVRNSSDGPRIVDVVVEGVSMAITQRSEFTSVIQQKGKGLGGLNEVLESKLARAQ
jgi:phospholipid transport system substrate-binding protein